MMNHLGLRFAGLLLASGCMLPLPSHAETVMVEMKGFKFVPPEITVKVGDTVRWINTEKRQYHTVWFKVQGDEESQIKFPDEYFEKTFDEPGTYPYVCGTHEESHDMVGVVHVIE